MIGRRCDLGCESWPNSKAYETCPICGGKTDVYHNLTPLDSDEAQSIVNRLEFEAYYREHCEKRGISVDGPL